MKRAFMTATVLLFLCGVVQAGSVSRLINYQGKLTDANGNVIHGSKTIELRIYDAAIGGTLVWGPQVFDPVPVEQGHFNVILSEDANQKKVIDAFLSDDAYSNERYLEITVGTATIAPRQQILSAPYAVQAVQAIHGDPVGSIQNYFGLTAPEGWLICDGGIIDKSLNPEYARLVDHLRDPAKVGSIDYQLTGKETQAKLPDLRGRATIGAGQGTGLSPRAFAQTGGEENHKLSINEMPKHRHDFLQGRKRTDSGWGEPYDYEYAKISGKVSGIIDYKGGSQPHNNMQPYIALNYIIKY